MLDAELATCRVKLLNCDTHHKRSLVARHHCLGLEHLVGDLGHKLCLSFLFERFESPSFADTMVFLIFDRDTVELIGNLPHEGSLLCVGLISSQYRMPLNQTYLV